MYLCIQVGECVKKMWICECEFQINQGYYVDNEHTVWRIFIVIYYSPWWSPWNGAQSCIYVPQAESSLEHAESTA